MNGIEAMTMLTVASGMDGRIEVSAEQGDLWAGALEDVSLEEAMWGVGQHYRISPLRVMPADVINLVMQRRQAREEREARTAGAANPRNSYRSCGNPHCTCPHTMCYKGWLDELVAETRFDGKVYWAAQRCPECQE